MFIAPRLNYSEATHSGFNTLERPPSFAAVLALPVAGDAAVAIATLIAVIAVTAHALVEVERAEQVADRGCVDRHIWVRAGLFRVRQIVAAAARDRGGLPVALDELHDGRVIVVLVRDASALRGRRSHAP